MSLEVTDFDVSSSMVCTLVTHWVELVSLRATYNTFAIRNRLGVTLVRELCVIGIHCVAAPCTIKRTSHHCWLGFPCVKAPEGLIVVVVG